MSVKHFALDMAPNKPSILTTYYYNLSFSAVPNPKLTVRHFFVSFFLSVIIPPHFSLTELKIYTKN